MNNYNHTGSNDQPRYIAPIEVSKEYNHGESVSPANIGEIGNVATHAAEQIDKLSEIKEMLRGQKKEALAGYFKFAEDLDEEQLSDEDFDKTFDYFINKWETDGSLKSLQDLLKDNQERKVYLSAYPNKVLPLKKLEKAAEHFLTDETQLKGMLLSIKLVKLREGLKETENIINNSSEPKEVLMDMTRGILSENLQKLAEKFGLPDESELEDVLIVLERISPKLSSESSLGNPEQDTNGDTLPVRLAVWTDTPELFARAMPRNPKDIPEYIQKNERDMGDLRKIEEMRKLYGTALNPIPSQLFGHWYRLRESGELDNVDITPGEYPRPGEQLLT